jgi:hypothetical protein
LYRKEAAVGQRQYGDARCLWSPPAQPSNLIGIAQRQSGRGALFGRVDRELYGNDHDHCKDNVKYQK